LSPKFGILINPFISISQNLGRYKEEKGRHQELTRRRRASQEQATTHHVVGI
jgi:hypothetical protein